MTFTVEDLCSLSALVSDAWLGAVDLDWSVPAGTLDWSCVFTADHAVDCVYAPAFFLASRRTDAYPTAGSNLTLGADATPAHLVESLGIATRILSAVVRDTPPETKAILFQRPVTLGSRDDFAPRAALELILHAHDVCSGLGVPFDPPRDLCARLRDHTREWPFWPSALSTTTDAWRDLLHASGRA